MDNDILSINVIDQNDIKEENLQHPKEETTDRTKILENMKTDKSWLSELKLSPVDHLLTIDRSICPQCSKKRKYFCYDCYIPFGDPEKNPKLKLPINVDIIHYPTELISKSTSIHCKVMARDDVNIIEYSPDHEYIYNYEETLLLYPSDDADFLTHVPNLDKVKKVIFIESQWHNTKKILANPSIQKIKCVKIDLQKTMFWRYQSMGDHCLATIEAIYYFFKEYHLASNNGLYNGEYDNLLYYYSLFYNLIQSEYKKKNVNFVKKKNYIQ
ncbi:hypothetical protein DLAC_03833 [Tieghemostelium lacteum]|uniref:tRNA-uridine aminocarboxypropyltransferase 1 n=1 Tax=Tieghemostelium lacteum TaxID=361077 RepID=A0A152A0Y8_TIELA|nr:hypothetical protein DLAC_03833 [Tieghemostelium lacteum]|eukprot:KYQ99879.1 hypothetical protein DLAC_03833 [Tieghemostelium lacteum]